MLKVYQVWYIHTEYMIPGLEVGHVVSSPVEAYQDSTLVQSRSVE